MIGYAELLNARMNGFTPEQVWVHALDCKPDGWLKQDAQEAIANGFHVSILILPNESVSTLDLIALNGLTIHFMGTSGRRSNEVIKVCHRYAKRVIHCLDGQLNPLRDTHAN